MKICLMIFLFAISVVLFFLSFTSNTNLILPKRLNVSNKKKYIKLSKIFSFIGAVSALIMAISETLAYLNISTFLNLNHVYLIANIAIIFICFGFIYINTKFVK